MTRPSEGKSLILVGAGGSGGEPLGARVRRLQDEARSLARQDVEAFSQRLQALCADAHEISSGGDAYPPGVRDLARQLADKLESDAQSLASIVLRVMA